MPGAPAVRQTSTARQTSGSRPPRELRSVATLFTLTDRLIIVVLRSTFYVRRSPFAVRRSPFAVRRSRFAGAVRTKNDEPRTIPSLSEMLFHDIHDLLCPAADLLLLPSFEHHAQ